MAYSLASRLIPASSPNPLRCERCKGRGKLLRLEPHRAGRRALKNSAPQGLRVCALSSSSSSPQSGAEYINLGGGDAILLPKSRKALGPSFDLDPSGALNVQLAVLKNNDKPYFDHGIEVMYRFANFDPFQRSHYFGKSFDLGQFERFRRIMHIPAYKALLNHESHTVLSTLQMSEQVWKARVLVVAYRTHEEAVYEWTLHQRLGGCYDGYWYTDSLVCDGHDWKALNITF